MVLNNFMSYIINNFNTMLNYVKTHNNVVFCFIFIFFISNFFYFFYFNFEFLKYFLCIFILSFFVLLCLFLEFEDDDSYIFANTILLYLNISIILSFFCFWYIHLIDLNNKKNYYLDLFLKLSDRSTKVRFGFISLFFLSLSTLKIKKKKDSDKIYSCNVYLIRCFRIFWSKFFFLQKLGGDLASLYLFFCFLSFFFYFLKFYHIIFLLCFYCFFFFTFILFVFICSILIYIYLELFFFSFRVNKVYKNKYNKSNFFRNYPIAHPEIIECTDYKPQLIFIDLKLLSNYILNIFFKIKNMFR